MRRDDKIAFCDQPLAPDRRRRFYLAIRWSVPHCPRASLANPHQPAKAYEPRIRRFIAASAPVIRARTGHRLAMVSSLDAHSPHRTAAADLHPECSHSCRRSSPSRETGRSTRPGADHPLQLVAPRNRADWAQGAPLGAASNGPSILPGMSKSDASPLAADVRTASANL